MTLNKKLACLRKKEGLSQAGVSERLDVSRQAVSRWEAGESRPSTENLQALSKLYNVPLEYLLDNTAEISNRVEADGTKKDQFEGTAEKKIKYWAIGSCVVLMLLVLTAIIYIRGEEHTTPVGNMMVEEEDQYPSVGFSIDW